MAIELKTWGQELSELRKAISAVNTSQRYELNGRALHRADLQWLLAREKYLVSKLEQDGDVIAGSVQSRGNVEVSFG